MDPTPEELFGERMSMQGNNLPSSLAFFQRPVCGTYVCDTCASDLREKTPLTGEGAERDNPEKCSLLPRNDGGGGAMY